MKDYEVIEHTADIGIRVKGIDLKELFRNAALAMFDIIAEKSSPPSAFSSQPKRITVKQEAEDLEELFIEWLNELLSLSAAKELIFSEFNINNIEDKNLQAEVVGHDSKDYRMNTEIKAATYHQLKLEKVDSGWLAEVIFDV